MTSHAQFSSLSRRRAMHLGSASVAFVLAAGHQRSTLSGDRAILDANTAIARRVFEDGFNRRNATALETLYAADFVDRDAWARQMPGPAGLPISLEAFHTQFPQVIATVENTIAEANLVAARVTWHDIHPPAGSHVVGRTMHVFQIEHDQIVAQWSVGWEWMPRDVSVSPPVANPMETSQDR
jgi:predicted ester cyclase